MNAFIRLLYAALIAVAVVVFVGVGTSAVYPGPKMPEYPSFAYDDSQKNPESQKKQELYDKQWKQYEQDNKTHQKNVSAITAIIAVTVTLVGLWYMRRNEILGEGVALGGVAVSIYAVGTAVASEDRVMRLLAVTVFLVAALVLVHRRFIEPTTKPGTKTARQTKKKR